MITNLLCQTKKLANTRFAKTLFLYLAINNFMLRLQ